MKIIIPSKTSVVKNNCPLNLITGWATFAVTTGNDCMVYEAMVVLYLWGNYEQTFGIIYQSELFTTFVDRTSM